MILGTICARAGSKGIPGKNLKVLSGKPLILHTIDEAKKCNLLDDIIISTDSNEIAELGNKEGISVPFLRPAELSSDTAGKWEVFRHALLEYERSSNQKIDYLVDLDVSAPLKTSEDITSVIKFALDNPETDIIYCGYEPERNPYFTMVEINKEGNAELVKSTETAYIRRQDAPKVYSLSAAVLVIKREAILQFKHWTEAKTKIFPLPRERAIDIDTGLDFKIVECLMKIRTVSEP